MNDATARMLIESERVRIQQLLNSSVAGHLEDEDAKMETGADDADGAQPLEHEGIDDAVAESLRQRLSALDRAEQRLAAGTFGKSVESGVPIPDERLAVDPAAELTVDEATRHPHRH